MNSEQQSLIYQTATGALEVRLDTADDTVWLSQAQMSQLFSTTPENVLMHLKNIFQEAELDESATTKDFLVVRLEGRRQVKRNIKHYNFDAIISVGYRVSSKRAVAFRQWATRTLREHLTQGFTLNQQRIAQNAQAFEAALALIQKAAHSPALTTDISIADCRVRPEAKRHHDSVGHAHAGLAQIMSTTSETSTCPTPLS